MNCFDTYSPYFNIAEENKLKISNDSYNVFKEEMDKLNYDCVINNAKSCKIASEIVLTY